ncbi:sigma-B regulation protein RsbQ [Marinobacter daqiaonensis]|uniref:Sigma-B regulation protein RsbQ n=1 Tax=Marinobacter daqiaonensis TaxID=650891 RepID=A0A1I6JNS1_9GAMM|nr:alpha/beta hydrolase [Marinobacter daqiaonensis]SFR80605.1 sigma-B regulation protein RsbQ [Marinobacter daqiaonensis]
MPTKEQIAARNNVRIIGSGQKTLMLAHGFGCDQNMWHYLTPELSAHYTLVLFDHVGSGKSQLSAFSPSRYASLEGYARDVVEICQALDLTDVHFVGHSVSGTIGLLASLSEPGRFASHIMVCPSPCFLNDPPDYHGGFKRADLEELVELMDRNYIGWASYLAPLVMGTHSSDALIGELADSFCSTDPLVAKTFAQATFFADYRHLLPAAKHPALLLQSGTDALADENVGKYMHARMPRSTLRILPTEGHCIHMTHPDLVGKEIRAYLDQ